ncbi:RloB-like protein [Lachnospiraceae bacterium]|nr:RloB-like protein [Lachnospiraceae bacterium]
MSRVTKKVLKIFCEGDTEYNYFSSFKQKNKLSLAIRPVNMHGGGYKNFLKELRTDANNNCLAKFIVVDGDRANFESENLYELIEYCVVQNKSGRIPHILIIDNPDFEYVACLHSPKYKGNDYKKFLVKEFGYKEISDFKSDEKVFERLNSKDNSYSFLLKNINKSKTVIINHITVKKSLFQIIVESRINKDNLEKRGTNINDLFDVLVKLGEQV